MTAKVEAHVGGKPDMSGITIKWLGDDRLGFVPPAQTGPATVLLINTRHLRTERIACLPQASSCQYQVDASIARADGNLFDLSIGCLC